MRHQNDQEKQVLKQKAIDASIQSSIPCVFTQAVAYETPDQSTTTRDNRNTTRSERPPKGKGTSNTAAMVGGTAVLLGAGLGLLMFGNIAATSSNASVAGALDSIAQGLFNNLSLGSFAGIAGVMGDGVTAIGDAVQPVAAMAGSAVESVADCGSMVGGCSSCARGVMEIGSCVGACCHGTCTGLEGVLGALDGLSSVGDFGANCNIS